MTTTLWAGCAAGMMVLAAGIGLDGAHAALPACSGQQDHSTSSSAITAPQNPTGREYAYSGSGGGGGYVGAAGTFGYAELGAGGSGAYAAGSSSTGSPYGSVTVGASPSVCADGTTVP